MICKHLYFKKSFAVVLLACILSSLIGVRQVKAAAPQPPSLVSPANGSISSSNPPQLCASNAGDPQGLPVQIRFETWGGGEGDHISPWIDAGSTGNVVCWTDSGSWSSGGHSWQARAMNSNNEQSGASPDWGIIIPTPTTPTSPPASQPTTNPAPQPTCSINNLTMSPPPTQAVGTQISISASATCTNGVSSLRFSVDGNKIGTTSGSSGTVTWNTTGSAPTAHTINVDAADSVAGYIKSRSDNYDLSAGSPTQPPTPPRGPSLSIFTISPNSATVGDQVNIHVKVNSSKPGAEKLNVSCGGVSPIESTAVEFYSTWNTTGCPAGTASVAVYSRDVNDPNWVNPSSSTGTLSLSAAQVPVSTPTANFSADSENILQSQCTNLHWSTSNASSVDIDGTSVNASGDLQVCPTVTKKYTLTAHGHGGDANRNITIMVTTQSTVTAVAGSFQTGDIINIGGNVYVIVNGQRRLVPNPDTLDALGISRSLINNKGFSDTNLLTILQGADIPDVDRDNSSFVAFKNEIFPNTVSIVPINPTLISTSDSIQSSFTIGDVIQIGSDVFVINNGQRCLVPNPDTLDALGLSRSLINNKGFSGVDLLTIPRGPNIPDVNRDNSGFVAFKNEMFPNNTPISPTSSGNGSVTGNTLPLTTSCTSSNRNINIGNIVGLNQGTNIYDSPDFTASIIESVNTGSLAVLAINGPKIVNGTSWWQISQKQACNTGFDSGWVFVATVDSTQPPTQVNSGKIGDNLVLQNVLEPDGSFSKVLLPPVKSGPAGYEWVSYQQYQSTINEETEELNNIQNEYNQAFSFSKFDVNDLMDYLTANSPLIISAFSPDEQPVVTKFFNFIKSKSFDAGSTLLGMFIDELKFELTSQVMASLRSQTTKVNQIASIAADPSNWSADRNYLQVPSTIASPEFSPKPTAKEWLLGFSVDFVKKAVVSAILY